jgi:hypothetical protein
VLPTPIQVFAEIAARHGGVETRDIEAVRRWYSETLPTLSPEVIGEVLEELLEGEDEPYEAGFPRDYPTRVKVPTLRNATLAPTPRLALGWIVFLRRMVRRMKARPP